TSPQSPPDWMRCDRSPLVNAKTQHLIARRVGIPSRNLESGNHPPTHPARHLNDPQGVPEIVRQYAFHDEPKELNLTSRTPRPPGCATYSAGLCSSASRSMGRQAVG